MSNSELNQLRQKYAFGGAVAKKFVSSIDNAIQTLRQQKGTGEQMLKQIQASGAKKEEMDLRRVPQFLANKPSVTKEQLARHLEKNPIPQINVIEKVSKFGGKTRQWQDPDGAWSNNHAKFGDATLQTPGGKNYREHLLQLQMPADENTMFRRQEVFDKYQPDIDEMYRAIDSRVANGGNAGPFEDRLDHLLTKRDLEAHDAASLPDDNEYVNGHWDEPQVVAHVRTTDRTGPEGEKILHVEEMQSDWHQQAREARKGQAKVLAREKGISVADALKEISADAGYLTPKDDAALAKLNKDIYRVGREGVNEEEIMNHFVPGRIIRSNLLDQDLVNNYHDKVLAFNPNAGTKRDTSQWTVETINEYPHSGQREIRVRSGNGNLQAMHSGWRGTDADAIKQAAERNPPQSWAARVIEVDPKTGEPAPGALPRDINSQSNIDRTDPTLNTLRSYREQRDALSRKVPDAPFKSTWPDLAVKHVFDTAAREGYDKVSFAPASEHIKRYNMANYVDEITATLRPNGKFDIQGIKDKSPILNSKGISREDLAAHVGKDQAEKIVSQIDNRPKQDPSWDELDPPMVSLTGENLKMGTKQAAGMVKFYDEMLPKLVDKYSSKEFGVGAGRTFIPELDTGKIDRPWHHPSNISWAESRRVGNALSVDIPQSTKDKILSQGQKLFSVAPVAPVGLGLSQEEPAKYAKGGIAKKLAERAAKSIEAKVNRAKTEWEILHDTAQRNAALPVEQGGLGLPANNTYIDRANAPGMFPTDAYHATNVDVNNLDPKRAGSSSTTKTGKSKFVWSTSSPENANIYVDSAPDIIKQDKLHTFSNYGDTGRLSGKDLQDLQDKLRVQSGGVIYPLRINTENSLIKDAKGRVTTNKDFARQLLKNPNYESGIVNNTRDVSPDSASFSHYLTSNPANIRSRWAAYDPFRRHEADILAGVGVGGVLAPELISEELNKLKKKYAKGGEVAKNRAYRGEVRNTPQRKVTGLVAHLLKPISEFAGKYTVPEWDPIFGGMTGADLTGVESLRKVVEDASYGVPPTTGTGMTRTLNPEVLDAAGGATLLGQVGKAFVKGAAREAARQIHTGTGVLGSKVIDPRSPITTWHGSPHTFPPTANNPLGEFDPMKVGTGEGAQAYGVGAGYLAEAPAVAKGYRQTEGMYKRVTGGMTNKEEFIADHLSQGRPETSILDLYAQKYGGSFDDAMKDLINVKQMYGTGNLYKVDLPDEHVAKMLDWDKPLSEQHPSVQSALAKLDPDIYHPKGDEYSPDEVGAEIYLRMANSPLAKNQSDASEVMRNAGITGIRYLDAASRDAGKGTSNFVVFDPKHMNILERNPKYAKGGKVASAGGDWLAKKLVQYGNVEGIGMSKGGLPKTAANWVAKKLVQYQEQARPLSKAEGIEAGLYHPIGGSKKLVRPVSEMTSTKVPNTPMVPRKIISPEDLYGSYIVPALGDRTAAGSLLTHVGETKLDIPVQLLGGPDFMRSHAPYNSAWAVHKGAATGLLKQIRGEAGGRDVYMPNVAMAHTPSGDFSTMMTDTLLGQIGNSKITKKSIKEFDNNVKAVRPEFKGLLHPETRDMLNANGALRHAFVHEVGLTPNFNAGFPDLATTRVALTVPELIDVPLHSSGFTIAKLDPAGRIVTDPASPVHPSYNTQLAGQYVGGFAAQPPRSVMFPTFYNARRAAGLPESGDIRSFQTGHPGQVANQEWLDSVMNWMEKNPKVK